MPRKRSDSVHIQTEMMKRAVNKILPPDCVGLSENEMPFWDAVVATRLQWSKVDLIHAANLARCMASIEMNQQLLKIEGDVIMGGKHGTQPIPNPRFYILETLSRRSVNISTKIHVHAVATLGEAKNSKGKNSAYQKLQNSLEDSDEDDLLARPTFQ